MNYYAHGGLANVAQNIATKGRNGDTQLLHVSPNELQGLQALAKANGTTLTTNPDTGLPEAFNFKRLIPMVAGAALSPFITPMGAAAVVGGTYGLATGSVKQGIIAGIGAYGGAGITSGLSTAGAATAEGVAATEAAKLKAGQEIAKKAAETAALEGTVLPANYADLAAQSATPAQVGAQMSTADSYANVGRGIGELGTGEGRSAVYSAIPTGSLPATVASFAMPDEKSSGVPALEDDEYTKRLKRYRIGPDYKASEPVRPNPYYRATYAAEGGVMESFDDEAGNDMARGGIASLGGYSDGGRMLKGPGDGMSDSIPGVIGGKQPARLADGEFVVPADVVSHLGNGSTDGGAKKLYAMMDKIREARTGKKKQAPEINADKYLPVKQASGGMAGYSSGGIAGYADGGIARYADGGEIADLYKTYLGRTPAPEEIKAWQDTGAPFEQISQGIRKSEEAKAFVADKKNAEAVVKTIYQTQVGREPDPEGLKNYVTALQSGRTADEVAQEINQSLEGQNFDTQYITSLYRQNLQRNPEQQGFQWWLSMAQDAGYTPKELEAVLKQSATVEQKNRGIIPGTKFTEMELAALDADPSAGRYITTSMYAVPQDAVNVSTIGNRKVQFVNPVTQQQFITNFGNDKTWSETPGKDVLSDPVVLASLNRALSSGSITSAAYESVINDLNNAKTPEATRAVLSTPKAQVIVDALRGQQIGEDVNIDKARLEAAQRQAVLSAQDPGYYQNNYVLADAYKAAGLDYPFDRAAYTGYDTMMREKDVVTPENFQQKQNSLINAIKNNPYKVQYDLLNASKNPSTSAIRDPYSDEGLKLLYGQMMDQYGTPTPGKINPATVATTPYIYKPPLSPRLQEEAKAKADYDAKVAADKLAYDQAPINESNFDAAAYLRAYPTVANPAVWQSTPYSHYLEASGKGQNFVATKLPFTPTPFVAPPLFGPGTTPTAPATTDAVGSSLIGFQP